MSVFTIMRKELTLYFTSFLFYALAAAVGLAGLLSLLIKRRIGKRRMNESVDERIVRRDVVQRRPRQIIR